MIDLDSEYAWEVIRAGHKLPPDEVQDREALVTSLAKEEQVELRLELIGAHGFRSSEATQHVLWLFYEFPHTDLPLRLISFLNDSSRAHEEVKHVLLKRVEELAVDADTLGRAGEYLCRQRLPGRLARRKAGEVDSQEQEEADRIRGEELLEQAMRSSSRWAIVLGRHFLRRGGKRWDSSLTDGLRRRLLERGQAILADVWNSEREELSPSDRLGLAQSSFELGEHVLCREVVACLLDGSKGPFESVDLYKLAGRLALLDDRRADAKGFLDLAAEAATPDPNAPAIFVSIMWKTADELARELLACGETEAVADYCRKMAKAALVRGIDRSRQRRHEKYSNAVILLEAWKHPRWLKRS